MVVPVAMPAPALQASGVTAVAVHHGEFEGHVVQDVQPAQHVFRIVLNFGRIQHEDEFCVFHQPGIGGHCRELKPQEIEIAVEGMTMDASGEAGVWP